MAIRRLIPLWILVFVLLLPMICLGATSLVHLESPPLGERWFAISMNGERVGFARMTVEALPDGYELRSEGSVKLRVMTTSRESSSRERFLVGKDLSLKSFQVEQTIDGKEMKLQGTVEGKAVKVVVNTNGSSKKKTLKFKGKLLPPPALNFYPPMQGAVADKNYTVQMLDTEGVKVKDVEMTVIGRETLAGVESLHMQNDLYPFVDNDIWIDLAGNTIKESVRDGMILTVAENPLLVKNFIADVALAKRDMIIPFSLIKVQPPLQDPAKLKGMTAIFSGIPADFPLTKGPGQVATRLSDGSVQFRITTASEEVNNPDTAASAAPQVTAAGDKEVTAKAREIAGNEQDRRKMAEKLIRWLGTEVKVTTGDRLSPVETLKKGEGNAQSHAMLYLAMAQSLGIPSRMVSGLVYVKDKGFLYHSWAESDCGGWLAVDPTSGQVPADASHIKLIEGDGPEELALLGGIVGRLKGTITERQY